MNEGDRPEGARVSPTREDPLARWASGVVGGVLGRRAAVPGHTWWTAARVLVIAGAAMIGLAVLRAQHCRTSGWGSPGQFVHACYSDVAVLHATLGGSPAAMLGLDPAYPDGSGQPVLAAALLAGLTALASLLQPLLGALPGAADESGTRVVFDLYAVVAALLVAVLVLAVAALARHRPWDAGLVALSPVLALAGLVNVDLLGVALGAVAVWVWSRDRPVAAGVVLGLAVSARFHVVVVAVALLLLAARSGPWRPTVQALSAAAVTWAALNLPFAVLAPTAWSAPLRAWWATEPSYGALLQVPRLLQLEDVPYVRGLTPLSSSVVVLVLTAVVVAATAAWVVSAYRAPSLPVVVLVLLVGTLLVGKAVPVQASLWLLPWAALAVPRWRDHVLWWAAEGLYTVAIWQHLVGTAEPSRALPGGWLVFFVLLRLAAMANLAGRAVASANRRVAVRGTGEGVPAAAVPGVVV